MDLVHRPAAQMNRPYTSQFFFHLAGDIDFFLGRIFFCVCDCELVPIDSDDTLKLVEQCFGEESCTAVSVD